MSLIGGTLLAAQEPSTIPFYLGLLIALAVLILPYMLGNYLANRFRMPDHGWKLGVILVSITAGIVICAMGFPPNLGIDLKGGVILVYEVDPEEQGDADMGQLVQALVPRVNPGGQKEVTVRPFGQGQVEIIIPEADEAELRQMKSIIQQQGTLEFRILANTKDHRDIIRMANEQPDSLAIYGPDDEQLARWVPVDKGREGSFANDENLAVRPGNPAADEPMRVLVVNDRFNITGEYLDDAKARPDTGGWKVLFTFDSAGGRKFGRLTGANLPDQSGFARQLGIILNGYLYSAPRINSRIGAQGEITGDFTEEEAEALVTVLDAGSLPTALSEQPISELLIGPTLGRDTIRRGAWAIGISLVVVLLFMLLYYRFAGMIACGALLATLVLILAIMITVEAALTLPGLAGLVLTVGMAVDANVLIFERIREELDRGAALRMAIRNGFQRATSAIVDANVTTLLTAIVLWTIATDVIKGFALTLLLGVTLSMYTAIFCSRVIFEIAEKRRWITELKMMRALGRTNINFLGMRPAAAVVSTVVIVAGLVGVVSRGSGILDIDFTGGVSVQMVLDEPRSTAEVREALAELEDLVVSDIPLQDRPAGTQFMINTSQGDIVDEKTGEVITPATRYVEQHIQEVFGDDLASNAMTIEQIEPIAEAETGPAEEPATDEPTTEEPATEEPQPETPVIESPEPDEPTAEEPTEEPATEEPASEEANGASATSDSSAEETGEADASEEAPDSPTSDATSGTDADGEDSGDSGSTEEPDQASLPLPSGAARWLAPVMFGQGDAGDEATPDADGDADGDTGQATDENAGADGPAGRVSPPVDPLTEAPPVSRRPDARFAGGTQAELRFKRKIDYDSLKDLIGRELEEAGYRPDSVPLRLSNPEYDAGDSHPFEEWTVMLKLPEAEARSVLEATAEELSHQPYFPTSNTIGSRVADQLRDQAILAILFSLICIVAYIWLRFQRVMYGLAAVVALIHDVLVTLGLVALSAYVAQIPGVQDVLMIDPFKISLTMLAAFLTIIGYSLNDTIVVFDRIREVRGKSPRLTGEMINTSINQTLSRTLLTSLTTLIVVIILYFGGGQGIHGFAFALVVGVIVGTYSSIFVASPVLYWLAGSKE